VTYILEMTYKPCFGYYEGDFSTRRGHHHSSHRSRVISSPGTYMHHSD
jgi:hypothetical protein